MEVGVGVIMAEYPSQHTGLSDSFSDVEINSDPFLDENYEDEGCRLSSPPKNEAIVNSPPFDHSAKEERDEFIKCLLFALSPQKRSHWEKKYQLLKNGKGNIFIY